MPFRRQSAHPIPLRPIRFRLVLSLVFLIQAHEVDGQSLFYATSDFITGDGPRSVVIGDFNEDGREDLATANYYDDSVSILINVFCDNDDDGFESRACGGGDCDDLDSDVHPGMPETCDNRIDDDCDGLVDAADPDCGTEFTLELTASHDAGRMNLTYTVGCPEPALWANALVLIDPSVQVIPFFEVPLSVILPPVTVPLSFPFPGIGTVGIYTGLHTATGPQAVELVWVATDASNPDP